VRVSEKKIVMRVFRPKREQVIGEWRKLHKQEFHNFCSSRNIMVMNFRMRWTRHVARITEMRNIYKILVENPKGKRQLGRHKRRWEDSIGMDVREIG